MDPYKNGKMYYLRFSYLNKQYRFSLKTANKKVAMRVVEQIERGLERGLFDSFEAGYEGYALIQLMIGRPGLRVEEALEELRGAISRKCFDEAIAEYLDNCKTEHSSSNYRNETRVFSVIRKDWNLKFVHQATPEHIEKWRNKRVETVSKSTVNRELKMLKRFFSQSVDKGYISKSPAKAVRTYTESQQAIRHLADEEVKRLLNAAPEDLRRIIIFLLLTGMRYGELTHLEWSDIDFRHRQVHIRPKKGWTPKSYKPRFIPMHEAIEAILNDLSCHSKDGLVFPSKEGKNAHKALRNRLYRVFTNAGVKGTVKDLRSTFASNAVMSGMPIYTGQAPLFLGQESACL